MAFSYHEVLPLAMGQIKGFESALEALRALDQKSQQRILRDIAKTDPQMGAKLKSHLVLFDDLLKINPQGFQRLLQEVPDAKWVLALRGKDAKFVEALLKPLATRKTDLFKAALAQLGPQPLTRVEAAQREILAKALELEGQGLLVFADGKDPMV